MKTNKLNPRSTEKQIARLSRNLRSHDNFTISDEEGNTVGLCWAYYCFNDRVWWVKTYVGKTEKTREDCFDLNGRHVPAEHGIRRDVLPMILEAMKKLVEKNWVKSDKAYRVPSGNGFRMESR